jgi:hypothetical protein
MLIGGRPATAERSKTAVAQPSDTSFLPIRESSSEAHLLGLAPLMSLTAAAGLVLMLPIAARLAARPRPGYS